MIQIMKRMILVLGMLLSSGLATEGFLEETNASSRQPGNPLVIREANRRPVALPPLEANSDLLKERGRPHFLSAQVRHVYRVDLKAREFLSVVVQQRGIDVRLQLLDPERSILFTVDSHNDNEGPEPVRLVAERPGTYRMAVSTFEDPPPAGRYVIDVIERRPAKETDRAGALALQSYYKARELLQNHRPFEETENALSASVQALELVRDERLEADALDDLGNLYVSKQQWAKGSEINRRAVSLFQSQDRRGSEAVVLNNLALCEQHLSESEKARMHFQQALRLAREIVAGQKEYSGIKNYSLIHAQHSEASALTNLGMLQAERAEAWGAERSLQDALSIWRKLKIPNGEAQALRNFGVLYAEMGELEEALTIYSKAMSLPNLSADTRATILTQMGNAYVYSDQTARAFHCFQQALDLQRGGGDQENEASTLVGFGLAYAGSRDYRNALDPYQRALKIYKRLKDFRDQAITLIDIGWALNFMQRYDEARDAFNQALQLVRGSNNSTLEAAIRFGFAWMEQRRGHLSEAQRQGERALNLVESVRLQTLDSKLKLSFFSGKQDIYNLLIEILMDKHKIQNSRELLAKALQVSESAHARSLLDNLEGQAGDIAKSVLTVQEIQRQVLDPDTILLEYSLGEPKSYLWLVTQKDLRAFELPGRKEIESLATETYERIVRSQLPEARAKAIKKAQDLSQVLLGPVAKLLGSKRLLIVASGTLQVFPFAALPDPVVPFSKPDLRAVWPPPLILRHEIVYEPSASVLAEIRGTRADRAPATKLIATLADGVFEQDDPRLPRAVRRRVEGGGDPVLGYLDRLPASGQEAEAITAGLPSDQVMKAFGFDANRDLVISGRLKPFSIIHFATHTFFRAKQAELQAIILSHYDKNGRPREHLLKIQDIRALDLHADLIVLSSCSSGLGKNVPGEGVIGFPQAFLSAGARGVLMSVWDVEDKSTSVLMTKFYKNMFMRKMTPSEALKAAQISMWGDPLYNAPWFWAGFLAQGEWNNSPVSLNKSSPGVSTKVGGPKISPMAPIVTPPPPSS